MQSVPPNIAELPSKSQISQVVSSVVVSFSRDISELVASFADPFADAAVPLDIDEDGQITNPENYNLKKSALISRTCDPAIKAQVLIEMSSGEWHRAALSQMCKEIADQGYSINLDGAVLENLTLEDLNLRGLSALNCTFNNVELAYCDLTQAAVTGTRFNNCTFRATKIPSGAFEYDVAHDNSMLNRVQVIGTVDYDSRFHNFGSADYIESEYHGTVESPFFENATYSSYSCRAIATEAALADGYQTAATSAVSTDEAEVPTADSASEKSVPDAPSVDSPGL